MNTFKLLPDGNLLHDSGFVLITENEHLRLDLLTMDEFIAWMREGDDEELEKRVGRMLWEALGFLWGLN
ncbi:hypothetical protein [Advenella sp. EE-W14]|uniref:hypothetical protein n=1 Tax=Advenella sp. EE-W14 TaxID=2722705 RepID=UPI00145CCF29|nr:hypothetical protein [Advenella sp. EE-W14]